MNELITFFVGNLVATLLFLFVFVITKRRKDQKRSGELLDQWILGLLQGRMGDEEVRLFAQKFSSSVYDLFSHGLGSFDFEGRPILWRSGDGSTYLSFLVEGGGMTSRFSVEGNYRLTLQLVPGLESSSGPVGEHIV